MNHWCESCARKNLCYVVDDRPKCFVPITNTASGTPESYLAKLLPFSRDSHEIAKTEPQIDAYDSARFSHNCIGICENPMTYIAKAEDEPKSYTTWANTEPKQGTDCTQVDWKDQMWTEAVEDEPQTERSE